MPLKLCAYGVDEHISAVFVLETHLQHVTFGV